MLSSHEIWVTFLYEPGLFASRNNPARDNNEHARQGSYLQLS